MKPLVLRIVLLGCAGWTLTAWAGPDEEAVEQTIRSAAKAAATFSDTRDRQAILKLYASDYEGVQDGESESRAAIEKWLADYEAELKQGSTLRFIGSVSNLKTQVQARPPGHDTTTSFRPSATARSKARTWVNAPTCSARIPPAG